MVESEEGGECVTEFCRRLVFTVGGHTMTIDMGVFPSSVVSSDRSDSKNPVTANLDAQYAVR